MGLNRLLRLSDSTDGAQKIEEEKTVKGGWKGGGGAGRDGEGTPLLPLFFFFLLFFLLFSLLFISRNPLISI